MPYLSLSLLGPFQAWTADGASQSFRTLKERALLAYLVVEHNRVHRREMLASLFWPDRPEGVARNSLRQALFGIRQVIGDEGFNNIFSITGEEVQVNFGDQIWLDFAAYELHLEAAQAHRHPQGEPCPYCLKHLSDAIEIYHGSFLEDVDLDKNPAIQQWTQSQREHFQRLQIQALDALATEYEQQGDYHQAAFYAERQAQLETLNEAGVRRLMLLLARAGRTSAALEQYETLQQKLRQAALSGPDEKTVELAGQIREGRFEAGLSLDREVWHNLPEHLTPFIGRAMELTQIEGLLRNPDCRLISIVGMGGVGKTRLAIQSALLNLHLFPDGVCFVPLDTVPTADEIPEMVARSLGLALSAQQDIAGMLGAYLRSRRILLVLDNFEHLLAGCDLLLEILKEAPYVKMIITSRERLHLQAEFLIELQGLSFPAPTTDSPAAGVRGHPDIRLMAFQSDAVRLLLERAGRVMTNGSVAGAVSPAPAGRRSAAVPETTLQLRSAVRICQLVEGLPLGIELAASWARDYSFAEIADEVERNLDFLKTSYQDMPERHRSLRASFEHSWDLLSENEREVFCKLAVFPGAFSLAAAREIAGETLPWLVQLEDKSLVRRVAYGRYDLHPLIRQYAGLKLSNYSRKVIDHASRQHAEFFCNFLHDHELDLKGGRQAEALDEVEIDLENVRTAWNWAVAHHASNLLDRAAGGMMYFMEARGRWQEGEELFANAIESGQQNGMNEGTLGYLLAIRGWFCCRLTRFRQSEELLTQSLLYLTNTETDLQRGFAHFALGFLYIWMSRYQEALLHLTTCLSIGDRVGDSWTAAWARESLAEFAFESGQSGYQEEPFLETLAIFERIGEQRGRARALNYLGNLALAQHHLEDARAYFEKLLAISEKLGDVWGLAGGYTKLGLLASARGDYEQAWRNHQHSYLMLQKIGDQRRTAFALRELGEVACALKKPTEARDYFTQALEIASRTQSSAVSQDILTGIAAMMIQKTDYECFDLPEDMRLTGIPGNARLIDAAQILILVLDEDSGDQTTTQRAKDLLDAAQAALPAGSLDKIRSAMRARPTPELARALLSRNPIPL